MTATPFRASRLIAAAALLVLARASAAQDAALPGRLASRDATPGDTTQHVAAYFPSTFDAARPTPVLFVLDPRGRGQMALHLFAGAAERHGWVVVSSYNSASDQETDPNVDAMNAMLAYAQVNVRVDTTRMYLAGFSGTSRIAWALAAELRGKIAGIFGTGGAVSFSARGPEMIFGADSTFAFFGSAGSTDFNHDEMRSFAGRLRLARIPSRFAWFTGGHAWPPRALCEQAIDWFELRAMLGGRRLADTTFIARALARDLALADSLEHAGQWDAAETRYRDVAMDVPARTEGRTALAHADELAAREPLKALRTRMRELADGDVADSRREFKALADARTAPEPLPPDALLEKLGVESLKRRMASPDSLDRDAAARRLSNVSAFIAFYEPRAFLAADQPRRAAASLQAAAAIAPLRGESCDLARRAAEQLPREDAARLPPCA